MTTKSMEPILSELREEAAITRRVLERIPLDKLSWRPHAKSMSLGQLALHLASVQGRLAKILQQDEFDAPATNFDPPAPENLDQVRKTFEESVRAAADYLKGMSEQAAQAVWQLKVGGKPAFSSPRIGVIRSIMLNHCYHHRGQLSVYLRLLDVPVPVIYGRSADENPFA
jgi:uncharacterized damage-inducible protein DinB